MKTNLVCLGTSNEETQFVKDLLSSKFTISNLEKGKELISSLANTQFCFLLKVAPGSHANNLNTDILTYLNHNKAAVVLSRFLVWIDSVDSMNEELVQFVNEYANSSNVIIGEKWNSLNLGSAMNDCIDKVAVANDSYYLVKSNILMSTSIASCDVYLKLSELKYVKVVMRGSVNFYEEIIKKYENKKITDFYVKTSEYGIFQQAIIDELFNIDINELKKDPSKCLELSASVLVFARSIGVTDFMVQAVNDNFNEILSETKSLKGLNGLLSLFQKNSDSPIAKHSHLTAVICYLIASKTAWANAQVKKNLSLASLLHDLEILDSPKCHYEFKYLNELSNDKAKADYLNHPKKLALNLASLDQIPSDVINIILNHHEGIGELGFPLKKGSSQLSPVICLFITAHLFAIELCRLGYNFTKSYEALENIKVHLSTKSYLPFLDILDKEIRLL